MGVTNFDQINLDKETAIATTNALPTTEADATSEVTDYALTNDLKVKYNAAVTLINELKTKLNAICKG